MYGVRLLVSEEEFMVDDNVEVARSLEEAVRRLNGNAELAQVMDD